MKPTYARSVNASVLCCRMHKTTVPYLEHHNIIVPCPWPDCPNGTTKEEVQIGEMIFTRCRVGELWQWGELEVQS